MATHGCIDGFSHVIPFIHCSIDNSALTVLQLFVKACMEYGLPSRVRSDHGGENIKVALFINLVRQRRSHITGPSVHNERIERLWKDVHEQVTKPIYDELRQMECDPLTQLNTADPIHLFAVQHVYLPDVNRKLSNFRHAWNHHQMRTEHSRTPTQIWIDGMLTNMGSSYTATKELFGTSSLSLDESLERGLDKYGLSLNDLQGDPDDLGLHAESVQVPRHGLNLTEQQNQDITTASAGDGTNSVKVKIVIAKLQSFIIA